MDRRRAEESFARYVAVARTLRNLARWQRSYFGDYTANCTMREVRQALDHAHCTRSWLRSLKEEATP